MDGYGSDYDDGMDGYGSDYDDGMDGYGSDYYDVMDGYGSDYDDAMDGYGFGLGSDYEEIENENIEEELVELDHELEHELGEVHVHGDKHVHIRIDVD
eukprot:TRINITY_DN3244_c0_g1_i1.p1 TRINITY_DN3244_c0_g1~~TRINITY_DN3244_c0_g1_i1.p1  ORF type:complete len:114 (-),score=46.28 TRINITY_DN3244_c0_g1_i1:206-499(-)